MQCWSLSPLFSFCDPVPTQCPTNYMYIACYDSARGVSGSNIKPGGFVSFRLSDCQRCCSNAGPPGFQEGQSLVTWPGDHTPEFAYNITKHYTHKNIPGETQRLLQLLFSFQEIRELSLLPGLSSFFCLFFICTDVVGRDENNNLGSLELQSCCFLHCSSHCIVLCHS